VERPGAAGGIEITCLSCQRSSVWRALLSIPYGETRSYDDIARQIGHPAAMRAVGAPIAATRSRSWRRVIA
jgi:O6-methylguanine-DNA--protein-cysteine methyltransferase